MRKRFTASVDHETYVRLSMRAEIEQRPIAVMAGRLIEEALRPGGTAERRDGGVTAAEKDELRYETEE